MVFMNSPLYWDYWDDLDNSDTEDPLSRAFASEECREALRARVGPTNPYLWGYSYMNVRQFAFVVIESPLTFDRIFSDPLGDFARVQHALSQSECLLENGTAMNLELKESCNADSLLNYALLNRYCFQGEESNWVYYGTDPIQEESERLWIQDLEELWVTTKCKEFDSELKLTADKHADVIKSLSTLANPDSLGLSILKNTRRLFPERPLHEILPPWYLISTLIELAARLGDDAAALTSGSSFEEQGIYLGRFQELASNPSWQELRFKREPSQNRLLQTFNFLTTVESMDIEFDWEWLVRHLCEPPYPYEELDLQTAGSYTEWEEESTEPQSCRTVINELYTEGDLTDSLQEVIEQFENTALELDLFD